MARFFQSAVKNTIIFSTALFSAFTFAQGKLAIVIDDIGYHPKEDAEIFSDAKGNLCRHHSCRTLCQNPQSTSESAKSRYSYSYADAAGQQY